MEPPSNTVPFCETDIDLGEFYTLYESTNTGTNMVPYNITPNTARKLISASDSSIYPSTWRTIPSGTTASYVAHNEVLLRPGFTAEEGSEFIVRIEPCETCESQMLQVNSYSSTDTATFANDSTAAKILRCGDTTFVSRPSPMMLYPNPTGGRLTVRTDGEHVGVRLYDLSGHAVGGWRILASDEKNLEIDVAVLRPGSYLLQVVTNDGTYHTGRFIKL